MPPEDDYISLNKDHGLHIKMVNGKLTLELEDLWSGDTVGFIEIPKKAFPKLRKFIKAPKRTKPK